MDRTRDIRQAFRRANEADRFRRALEELNQELAGGVPGRRFRFLPPFMRPDAVHAREREHELALRQIDEAMIQRLVEFNEELVELDRASDVALRDAERAARLTRDRLDAMKQDATRDRNGRIVFRSEDGVHAFHEDGSAVSGQDLRTIEWRPESDSWERWQRTVSAYATATTEVETVGAYRRKLDAIEQRMSGDEPLDADELANLKRAAEEMPASIRRDLVSRGARSVSAAADAAPEDVFDNVAAARAAFNSAVTTAGPAEPPVTDIKPLPKPVQPQQ